MAIHDPPMRHPSLRLTKIATVVACIFFLPATALLPGLGSTLGMPWPVFFGTWGVMLFASFISFIGYFACRSRGERISTFYLICPMLLFVVFFVVFNLHDIVRALS